MSTIIDKTEDLGWSLLDKTPLQYPSRTQQTQLLPHLAHSREAVAILGTFIALANCANKITSETGKQFFEEIDKDQAS
jgi:hypothetical protein